MRRALCVLVLLLWGGCAAKDEPLPPLPPQPEDLSAWVVPELVQPSTHALLFEQAKERPPTKEEQVEEYRPGVSTKVVVPMDGPLDIVLQPGEDVHNIPGPADNVETPSGDGVQAEHANVIRWELKEGKHGMGEALHKHIFLRAKAPGLTTGLIITTTRRVYYLTARSVKTSPIRVVRWTYTDAPALLPPVPEPGVLPSPEDPRRYHVGYTVTSTQKQAPDWMPRHVVDDGKKLYILYPEIALRQTVPVIRMLGPNGPQLVNSLQFLSVVILDQLAPRVELRVGIGEQAEIVTIARGPLRTIDCPGDPACPVWPAAAHTLARRSHP